MYSELRKLVSEEKKKINEEKKLEEVPLDMMKHPLAHSWNFWMFTNQKNCWEANLVKLATFDTVEDYWSLYHYMKQPSELSFGQDYLVFKEDIQPMWEDTANRNGGRWLVSFERKRNIPLDTAWMLVVLIMIGENFESRDAVCGAVINVRSKSKIGIWITDSSNARAILEIGQLLKEKLNFGSKMNFHPHNCAKNLFTI